MIKKLLAVVALLLVSHASPLFAKTFPDAFRAGPVYLEQPGRLAAVVELPPGSVPGPADFHLVIDGRKVADASEVKAFEESGKGLALAVCVDVSGSMRGGPLREAKEALLSLLAVAAKRPQDRFALVSFADDAKVESSFVASRQRLTDAVIRLKTRGSQTRLYHALYQALNLLQDPNLPERRRVIVISDGKDEGSTESLENVTTKSKALDIPIDAIGRGNIAERYLQVLSGIAESAGGQFIETRPDTLSLKDAMARVYRDLLETRSLVVYFDYERQQPASMSQNASIEVTRVGDENLTAALSTPIPLAKQAAEVQPAAPPAATPPVVPAQAQTTPPPQTVTVTDWKKTAWVLLPLIVLIAIVFALVMRMRNRKPALPVVPPTPAPQPPPGPPEEPPTILPYGEPSKETRVSGYLPVPQPGNPAAVLVGVGGPAEGMRFPIEKAVVRIGADRSNDFCITGDEYVSRNHAYIRYEGGSLFVVDEGSLNGTYVNERKVTSTAVAIGPGDRLRFGNSTFLLQGAGPG